MIHATDMTRDEVATIVRDTLGVKALSASWSVSVDRYVAGKTPRTSTDAYVAGYVKNAMKRQ